MSPQRLVLLLPAILLALYTCAQTSDSLPRALSPKYLDKVSIESGKIAGKLEKRSEKTLQQFQKQEAKLKRKLAKTDSLKAAAVFGNAKQQYEQLDQKLKKTSSLQQYIPSLDTLGTSLKFLQQNPQLLSTVKGAQQKLTGATGKVKALQEQFQKAEDIRKFLKERKQYLKEQLGQVGFAKEFKQLNKQTYYYQQQVNEYKELLKDHTKAEKKAIELLSKTKLFKDFMRKNSMLASLFRLPGDPNDPLAQASLAGLQTRAQVTALIQQQIAAGGPNGQAQFQQSMQDAQSQLNQLKNRFTQLGKGSSDADPDSYRELGFKPNDQKTRSFLKRLELGTNIQSQRASGFFPASSDIGLSAGYKLNDKSIIGIGTSYKLGWGKDIRHIKISHQGVGLRSFIDWKLSSPKGGGREGAGSFWLSGGYEMNYRSAFRNIEVLKDLGAWQQSGLIGISKVISMKTKFFKKTKLQLLWDFLSYQQVPRTQPVVFRIGYNF